MRVLWVPELCVLCSGLFFAVRDVHPRPQARFSAAGCQVKLMGASRSGGGRSAAPSMDAAAWLSHEKVLSSSRVCTNSCLVMSPDLFLSKSSMVSSMSSLLRPAEDCLPPAQKISQL